MSKDQKIAATKRYVHAMKNLDTGLNGEFIVSSLSYYFCYFLLLPQLTLLLALKFLIMVSVLQFLRQAGVNYILFRLV